MSKQQIMQMLEKMPDDSTDLDILEKIKEIVLVKQKIKKSREDIKNGRVLPHEEVFKKYE